MSSSWNPTVYRNGWCFPGLPGVIRRGWGNAGPAGRKTFLMVCSLVSWHEWASHSISAGASGVGKHLHGLPSATGRERSRTETGQRFGSPWVWFTCYWTVFYHWVEDWEALGLDLLLLGGGPEAAWARSLLLEEGYGDSWYHQYRWRGLCATAWCGVGNGLAPWVLLLPFL